VQPYTFQRGTLLGFLPTGMTLHPSGVREGIPDPAKAQPGVYELEICAVDNTRSSVCRKTKLTLRAGPATKEAGPRVGASEGVYRIREEYPEWSCTDNERGAFRKRET